VAGLCFPPGTSVSPTNKTDHHDRTEILLKVALNTLKKRISTEYQSLNPAHGEVYLIQHYVIKFVNEWD
jgi:hypothetical protein